MTSYVTIFEEYKHKFFQLPKVFFTNEEYKDLSANAKIAWSILRDRSELSRENDWYEKDTGRIYFIYTNKKLMEILNVKSTSTLATIKKDLESVGLIEQRRMGTNKPNRLYLLYPKVTEQDIYKIDKMESNHEETAKNNEESYPQSQSVDNNGDSKIEHPKIEHPDVRKSNTNDTELNNTDLKDLDTIDTPAEQSKIPEKMSSEERSRLRESYFEKGFYENKELVPKEISNMLKAFSRTPEDAMEYYNIILLAKKKIQNERKTFIWLEEEPELISQIINTFSRSIRKIEQESNIENKKGYLYKAIYANIDDFVTQRSMVPITDGIYYNWLEEGDSDV